MTINHNNANEDKQQLVTQGPLVYLSNYTQNNTAATPEAGLDKARQTFDKLNGHIAVLGSDGTFKSGAAAVTPESLAPGMVVRVGKGADTHYYRKTAEQISTGSAVPNATAWVEVSAPTPAEPKGKALNGEMIVAAAGFTGRADRVKEVLSKGGAEPTTPEEKALYQATPSTMFFRGQGGYNPQMAGMGSFLDRAVAETEKQGVKVTEVHNIGHSLGAGPAVVANALAQKKGLKSDLLLTEPHQIHSQLDAVRQDGGAALGLNASDLNNMTSNSATLWSGRDNIFQNLGLGATETAAQFTVTASGGNDNSQRAAMDNHDLANTVAVNLGAGEPAPESAAAPAFGAPPAGTGTQPQPTAARQDLAAQLAPLGEFGAFLGMIINLLSGGGLQQGKGNDLGSLLAGLSGVSMPSASAPAGPAVNAPRAPGTPGISL